MSSLTWAVTAALLSLSASFAVHAQSPAAPAVAPAATPAAVAAPAPSAAPAKAAPTVVTSATAGDVSEGKLAYYSSKFNGRKTASGERYNASAMTMAHNSLPFGTQVKVTNLANQRSVVVRVNDRGPSTPGRVGDLSLAAAQKLGAIRKGSIDAKLEVVGMNKARGTKKVETG